MPGQEGGLYLYLAFFTERALTVVKKGVNSVSYVFKNITITQNKLMPSSHRLEIAVGPEEAAFPQAGRGRALTPPPRRRRPPSEAVLSPLPAPGRAPATDWSGEASAMMDAPTVLTPVRGGPVLPPLPSRRPPPGGAPPPPSPCTAHSAPAAGWAAPPASSPARRSPAPSPAGARRCAPQW